MNKHDIYYILDGKTPKPVYDILEWGKWYGTANRIVKQTQIGDVKVSTVFLGLDHELFEGVPFLFETMIFSNDENDGYQKRYTTWEEAEAGHQKAIELVFEVNAG